MFASCSADYANTPPEHSCLSGVFSACRCFTGDLTDERWIHDDDRTGRLIALFPKILKFDRKKLPLSDLMKGYQISSV